MADTESEMTLKVKVDWGVPGMPTSDFSDENVVKWDHRFMSVAELVASWSKDPSSKVGCVLVDGDRHIVATGYNGFPTGTNDNPRVYEDRPRKYLRVIHAETNAILQAKGSVMYCTAYVTHPPCSQCMGLLIQAGVARVVTRRPSPEMAERFRDSFAEANQMAREAFVAITCLP